MKTFTILAASCLIGTCGGYIFGPSIQLASLDPMKTNEAGLPVQAELPEPKTLTGDYLSSLFAQRHHDWKKAGEYLGDVMRNAPTDSGLLKRAMVLSMGAGDTDAAISMAHKVLEQEKDNALALLFLAVGSLHDKNYTQASATLNTLPMDSLSEFIVPLLRSWGQAAIGTYDVKGLDKNTIHIHHAVLISDFLKQTKDQEAMIDKGAAMPQMTVEDAERLANLYAHINKGDKALALYEKILQQWPNYPKIAERVESLKAGKLVDPLVGVKSPEEGIAATLYDMANLLYREEADDSARVFAQMALYLTPGITDAHLLLAAINARNERYEEAIRSYKMIPPENAYYIESRRRAADLMEESGNIDGALAELDALAKTRGDLESMIKTGDIYRRQENFPKAIEVYNETATKLGEKVPKDYWHLLYVRGMAYERAGNWAQAEADLKAALDYQPNHPFILNYLGYAWADKGLNLDQALGMIQKAATLQPNDGYIVDSLGWALYRMGRYKESMPHLERAVELLPYDATINDHLGDIYWKTGRKQEARFQWQRARNITKEQDLIAKLDAKIGEGLPEDKVMVKEAHSQALPTPDAQPPVSATP
ncbi:MAG: tetratricopeptide repeat protein [Alphaproteobacteria bacterium]|nr:tetratricopeptide repeat protein [Alphaproteobacteria bacterium]